MSAAAPPTPDPRPLHAAGLLLGMGLGGFVDGIVFHQILQLHNMLSARVPPTTVPNIEINMVWDGVFHAAVWCLTLLGVMALYQAGRRDRSALWSGRALLGSGLQGWGWFNLVEGIIDHHLLNLHHVVERAGDSVFDYLFLAAGLLLLLAGGALRRSALTEEPPPPRTQ